MNNTHSSFFFLFVLGRLLVFFSFIPECTNYQYCDADSLNVSFFALLFLPSMLDPFLALGLTYSSLFGSKHQVTGLGLLQ
jgi:hypothetical protein